MAVCRKLSAFAAISLSLSSAVNAQINEQDRLNRCQNNRQALARLEAVRGNYATEEQIARARTALVAIRRIEAEINRNLARVNELDSLRPTTYWSDINAQRTWPDPRSKIDTEIVALTNANKNLDNQIRSIGASVQFHCANDDFACVLTLSQRLASGIDGAVAAAAALSPVSATG